MKVLFLSEWYPHRYDAMAGLFVRKHAQAVVRQGVEVTVLYMHLDKHIHKEELIEQVTDGVREVYVYYPCKWDFLRAFRHGYQHIKRSWGRPNVCQLNVISKNGLLPLYLWKVFSIPYIIIEHWSGYLPMNREHSIRRPHLALARILTRNAQAVLPVSGLLMNSMKELGMCCRHWQIIHNVVDDFFYTAPPQNAQHPTPNTTHFIHISCFDEQAKNIQGMLRAIRRVADERYDFHVTMVGTGVDFEVDKAYAESLGLVPQWVTFTGELTPPQVAKQLSQASSLIMFSRYENAPVVISEALAAGVPVLTSAAGGIPEMLPSSCGRIVEVENEEDLSQHIKLFLDGQLDFDAETIREVGKRYSFDAVGQEMVQIYAKANKFDKKM